MVALLPSLCKKSLFYCRVLHILHLQYIMLVFHKTLELCSLDNYFQNWQINKALLNMYFSVLILETIVISGSCSCTYEDDGLLGCCTMYSD